jgi:PAS domain S-box-containing protein
MESQVEHKILLDQISDIVFSLDVPGHIIYVNKAVEKVLGYQVERLIGEHVSTILLPESWQEIQYQFQINIKFGREVIVPTSFKKADGDLAILETKAIPVFQGGKIVAIQGICRDITEKVQLEEMLKQEKWQAQVLYNISAILNQPLELEELLRLCLDKLCEYMAVPIGYIRSFDFDAGTTRLLVGLGLSEKYVSEEKTFPIKLVESSFYTRLSQGNSIIIKDFEKDPQLPRKKLLYEGVKSAVYIPIKPREGSPIGILTLASREKGHFKPEILPFLETICSQIGIAAERALLREKLVRTKEKYQHIFTNANDLIYIIDLEGYFLEANLAAREYIGYEPGKKIRLKDIIPPDKPEECVKIEEVLKQLLKEEIITSSFEIEILKQDGERAILETQGVLLKDSDGNPIAFQGISRDITERKRLERELTEAQKFLTGILEQMLDLVIVTDPHGIITFFNPGVKTVFRYEAEEMLGQPIWKFYPKGKKEAKKIMAHLMREGKLANYELDLIDKEGKLIPLLISIVLLKDEKGEIIGTLGVAKDLTEKKALERQILQSEKLASIGRLTAGAAHEIFNPMQIILGISQLLMARKDLAENVVAQLKRIELQVKRVTNVINGMLQFSRTSSQERDILDLNAALKEALALINYDFPKAGVDIVVQLNPQPIMVYGNKGELTQLFVNLLINARDAMPKGGKIIVTTSTYINQGEIWIRASITDTGVGISSEILPKIFDPFFSTKEVGKGTGLGLAICHGIVERHGGYISVESQPGHGTTFIIDLPSIMKDQGL